MPKIKTLDPLLIPKIAAGQVVERPVSVVKELIENSLDAGATIITVEIDAGGTELIRITDNGEGMDREDLLNSFKPHTTSKISTLDDLHNVKTLGFRGEALSSIAAVSDLKIKSKFVKSNVGYELSILYGTEPIINTTSLNTGTVVEVRNLFGNVPARKKFLKSATTEYKHILQLLIGYALSREDLSLSLSHNGKEVFSVSKIMPLLEKAELLLGKDIATNMLSLSPLKERIQFHGYIAKPQASTYSTDHQYLFVNGRFVSSPIVSAAIKDAYADLIEPKAFIPFILYLKLDSPLVDVNVHPRKEEIRFWDDAAVYQYVFDAVTNTLSTHNLTYRYGEEANSYQLDKKAVKGTFLRLKDSVDTWNPKGLSKEFDPTQNIQIFNTYILYQSSEGLVLIDQHAAHESILYTQFVAAYKNNKSSASTILLREPVVLDFSLQEKTILTENLDLLRTYGFDISVFGSNSFKVAAIPEMFKDHDVKNLLKEILVDLQSAKGIKDIDEKTKKTLQFLSCRGAIKAGEKLTMEERVNIIKKLEKENDTYVCPHGRPVKMILSRHELERLFKRIK